MDCTMENNTLRIALAGHIDSTNAPETEKQIMAAREQHPHDALVLDMQDLSYISSAGLRVVLRLYKLEKEMKLVNVSAQVYEILDMTGFAEMMPVQKAYRNISVEGCEVIGQGANGVVYRIDQDTVVKVYRNPDCLPDVQRERELARKAFVLGIPTAIPYDVVKVGASYGSVFELLNSQSFSKLIAKNPEKIDEYVGRYVDLMRKMHGTHVKPGDMPDIKDFALDCVNYAQQQLPRETGEKLRRMVEEIPDTGTMLHGDYHTNNIVMQNGEVLILDMDTLCTGHPVFELASMCMAFVCFGEQDPGIVMKFLKLPYETAKLFWKKALSAYLNTRDEAAISAVEDKAYVLSYARMLRRTIRRNGLNTEEGRATIEHCKRRLVELIDRVDNLYF